MSLSVAFLSTCRTAVAATPELTAFRAALAAYQSASPDLKLAKWHLLFTPGADGTSPAGSLRRAVRECITRALEAAGTPEVALADREEAYRTLAGEVVTDFERPRTTAEQAAEVAVVNLVG
jgi:hypothetical protein